MAGYGRRHVIERKIINSICDHQHRRNVIANSPVLRLVSAPLAAAARIAARNAWRKAGGVAAAVGARRARHRRAREEKRERGGEERERRKRHGSKTAASAK